MAETELQKHRKKISDKTILKGKWSGDEVDEADLKRNMTSNKSVNTKIRNNDTRVDESEFSISSVHPTNEVSKTIEKYEKISIDF